MIRNKYLLFIACLAISAMALAGFAGAVYGPGMAADSTRYLSTAENFLAGRGLVDYSGFPLLWWAPLYPVLLAGISFVTRVDVLQAGWMLNILTYGANIFLSGVLFEKTLKGWPIFKYLASLFIFLSPSLLSVHSAILSEPLYITFTLLFLLALCAYVETKSSKAFWAMTVFAILASLQRYIGLAQVISGGLLILYVHRQDVRRGIRESCLFVVISSIPLAAWIIGHHYLQYGTLSISAASKAEPLTNLQLSLTKIFHWFVPFYPIIYKIVSQPFILICAFILFLLLINRKQNWAEWIKAMETPRVLAILVFSLVYFISVTLLTGTADQRTLSSDRYFVVIQTPIIIFLLIIVEKLVIAHIKLERRFVEYGLIAIFALWALYPLQNLQTYVRAFRENGEPTYDIYNSRIVRSSHTLQKALELIKQEPQARFYSNFPAVLWFYSRQQQRDSLPPAPAPKTDVTEQLAGWPGEKPGYIVWFEPDVLEYFAPPATLAKVASVTLLYHLPDGSIYYASPAQ